MVYTTSVVGPWNLLGFRALLLTHAPSFIGRPFLANHPGQVVATPSGSAGRAAGNSTGWRADGRALSRIVENDLAVTKTAHGPSSIGLVPAPSVCAAFPQQGLGPSRKQDRCGQVDGHEHQGEDDVPEYG